MIIVVDGPAGSGKSSTAKAIARRLNIRFLDSGALYRALTYLWMKAGKPDKKTFFDNLPDIQLNIRYEDQTFFVFLNGENITAEIRRHDVSSHVSEVASCSAARKRVNRLMKKIVQKNTWIADGRDLGTAVFPDAVMKFYMDASITARARRRYEEQKIAEPDITLEQVRKNLEHRDYQDRNRDTDPLRKAEDAVLIDTTGKTFEEQVSEMIFMIKQKLKL